MITDDEYLHLIYGSNEDEEHIIPIELGDDKNINLSLQELYRIVKIQQKDIAGLKDGLKRQKSMMSKLLRSLRSKYQDINQIERQLAELRNDDY